jgi:integrase
VVNALDEHVRDYLRLRRGLGFKLHYPGIVLPQFVAYLNAAGAGTITCEHAIAWARLPQGVTAIHWAHRLGAVRGFATYLKSIDAATEIPPHDVFGAHQQRPVPYIWSPDEIRALLHAAGELATPHRAETMTTLFGLLAVTGMRVGEALALSEEDVDLDTGVLSVTASKTGRSRLVPVHPSTAQALGTYQVKRRRWFPDSGHESFFVCTTGRPLRYSSVQGVFRTLTTAIGVRTQQCHPRIHDLRHSMAVATLIGWQRSGVDVSVMLPRLSAYLGHVNPAGTYWYLQAVPELMELAAARLSAPPATDPDHTPGEQ